MVAAESFGLGSCYIGDILENCEDVRSALALPPYAVPAAMLVLGRPTQQQRERRKPARFDARYIVRENRYRRMTPEEHEAMYRAREAAEGRADVDYAARMQAFCARKYNSVFSREMSRSAAVYLRAFSAQCTPGTEEGNARRPEDGEQPCGNGLTCAGASRPALRAGCILAMCSALCWPGFPPAAGADASLLRIEDLDVRRCKPEHARLLEEDLAWLGLDWDEGGRRGGPDGPYFQSECSELYAQALQMLKEHARVYPCFCSRADLHAASAPAPFRRRRTVRRTVRAAFSPRRTLCAGGARPLCALPCRKSPFLSQTDILDIFAEPRPGMRRFHPAALGRYLCLPAGRGGRRRAHGRDAGGAWAGPALQHAAPDFLQRLLGLPTPEYSPFAAAGERGGRPALQAGKKAWTWVRCAPASRPQADGLASLWPDSSPRRNRCRSGRWPHAFPGKRCPGGISPYPPGC